MPVRRNGLGKGLDSLIPDKSGKSGKNESKSEKVLKKELNHPEREKTSLENADSLHEEKKFYETDLSSAIHSDNDKQLNDKEENKGELLLNINEVEPNRNQPRK